MPNDGGAWDVIHPSVSPKCGNKVWLKEKRGDGWALKGRCCDSHIHHPAYVEVLLSFNSLRH